MEISYERYEEIKNVVANTLSNAQITEIPICPFTLSNSLGIDTIPYSSLSEEKQECCLKFSNDGFTLNNVIYYNDSINKNRIRFTIMHEIGHIILNHNEEDDLFEKEANFFAKYILAPPILIFAYDNKLDMDEYKIRSIFQISNEFSKNVFEYYQTWLNIYKVSYYLCPADVKIYNLFFNSKYKIS